ncbi:MAG: phenylacetate-coenzyme A ligase PaaK-like adenylate-forming protein [Moritella dasanensis]|jgi:phenylacetate-coenzyme A ligase PaaK-like adenylate-forming protein
MSNNELILNIKKLGLDPLKVSLSSIKELYALPDKVLNDYKFFLIKEAFVNHYENNFFYKNACEEKRITPESIQCFEDLVKIPLIPIELFKSNDSHKLLTVSLNNIELEIRSTGTSGIPSVSRRCQNTVDNAILSIYAMYREFFKISKGAGLYLCPSTEEIPEMGMIKVLNLLAGLLDTHKFMVNNESFIPEDAVKQLEEWGNNFTRHIIGPPFLINRFISFLKAGNVKLKLDKGSKIITLGGWKRFSGEMLSRAEFNQDCIDYLGVEQCDIRDIYALVESNTLVIDDEFGDKHVSPITHFSVRDPKQLNNEVAVGEIGQLAILDPTSESTPGFILTEDLVRLLPGKSKSGRSGQRMQSLMRLPESKEFGCCAVNLDKRLDDLENDNSCPVAR